MGLVREAALKVEIPTMPVLPDPFPHPVHTSSSLNKDRFNHAGLSYMLEAQPLNPKATVGYCGLRRNAERRSDEDAELDKSLYRRPEGLL